MADLTQVVYISRATFEPMPAAAGGVEPHVARILQQSRSNNPRLGLGGVLYYGEGSFFQCLEGERSVVDDMLAKLQKDDRHQDFKVVYRTDVSERQFSDWSMKYIPSSEAVKALLSKEGYRSFDPYQFDESMVKKLLATFRELREEARPAAQGSAATPPRPQPPGRTAPFIMIGALVVIFAVIVGVIVF